ncbi:hypothetical protein Vretifemale_8619 [Volvox reticuliferus]|nr:hypothetical protein Vretifemale_8619 [Volvox reticuliferus]
MSSADIAVINEAARRYNFPQAVERQQQPGADGNTAVAASPPGVTRTLTVRRHPPEPRFSPTDRRQAATSPNKPAAAPGIVATERTDDLLRVLRSPEPPASMSIGSCVGLSGRSSGKCDITGDAGGEGPMAPRPPLAAAGKIGGSGSFRRSSSIRTRISSQSTGEVPASVVAVTAAAGCESDATGSSPPLRPSISHSMSPQDAYEPQSLHGLSSCSSVFEARVGSGSRGDGDAARPSEEGAAAATNGPEDLNGLGGGGGGSTSAVTSPTAAGFSKSSGPLRGWSSRKELLKSPFASSKTHTLTTDARQGGDSEGESADESQQALRRSPSMARATSRLSISGSAAAALAAAVGRISVNIRVADETDGGGRGRLPSEGGSCSSNGRGNDDDCAPGARSAVPVAHAVCASGEDPDLPPALQGLMRMGGFRADIRNLLRASGKFMLIRKFKQAEKVATSVKMKEQNWKKC